eukprot:3028863-Prymnesium_polylepis.2
MNDAFIRPTMGAARAFIDAISQAPAAPYTPHAPPWPPCPALSLMPRPIPHAPPYPSPDLYP